MVKIGYQVAGLGDVNGDGLSDMLLTAGSNQWTNHALRGVWAGGDHDGESVGPVSGHGCLGFMLGAEQWSMTAGGALAT